MRGNMKKEIFAILCSLFCFGYCILIYSIKSGTRFYLIWGAGGCFFLGLTAFWHFGMWAKLPHVLQRAVILVAALGVLVFVIVEGCIISSCRAKGEPNLDYENTRCIGSGGQGANEPHSEAQGMYDYLVGKGIDKERIIMEDKSTDTSENIAFSSVFLDVENDHVGIVTNNFHVFRGVHLAKHQGIQNVCGIAAPSNVYFQLNNMVREFFGIIKDLVCGNLI